MAKTSALRLADVRRMMDLAGDLSTLPPLSEPWMERLLIGLLQLVPAKVAFFQNQRGFLPGRQPISVAGYAVGFLDEEGKRDLEKVVEEINEHSERQADLSMRGRGRVAYHGALPSDGYDPFLFKLMHIPKRLYTHRRVELVPDGEWYRAPLVANHLRGSQQVDDNVISICRLDADGCAIGCALYRDAADRTPISARERTILHLVHGQISRTYRQMELESVAEKSLNLSPRLRQTLDGLLAGEGEKQIAYRLGLSRHTVHEYIGLLYRKFEVSDRAELLVRLLGDQRSAWHDPDSGTQC